MNKNKSEIILDYKVKEELVIEYLDATIGDQIVLNSFIRSLKILNITNSYITIGLQDKTALEIIREKYIDQLKDAIKNIFDNNLKIKLVVGDIDVPKFDPEETGSKYLSKKLTLDNYVESSFNAKIITIAKTILKNPGEFSPVFIYSSSGNGKTHLLHAIGNKYDEAGLSSIYIESNKFVNDVIEYSKIPGKLNKFTDSFKVFDVLLFDDVQNLGNKNVTMNVLFTILNQHFNEDKQIVIAADKNPDELIGITERLKTRFEAGIIEKIENPDEADIEKILMSKLKYMKLSPKKWESEAIKFLATNNISSIRKLEGSIKKVKLHTLNQNNVEYTATVIKSIFKDLTLDEKDLTPNRVIEKVSKYYKITKTQVTGKSRMKELVVARQMIFYILRNMLKMPYKEIGKMMNRDHSTVMSGINKIEKSIKTDNTVKVAYNRIQNKIKSYN